VVSADAAAEWKDKIDVLILCGGSKTDLMEQGPNFAKLFNTVDSYDTHAKIPGYFDAVDAAAKEAGKLSVISLGWDPGLFSLMRLYMSAFIPDGKTYSFWGPGVSQGHSEAIRSITGVADAIQYTIPNTIAMEKIRNGETPNLSARDKHKRECYVVIEEGSDQAAIEREIKTMPDYFLEYETTVRFISREVFRINHNKLMHGGNVMHSGTTGAGHSQTLEFSLTLDSNPEFTSSILLAFARAAYRLALRGETGARTIFDIPPALLHASDIKELVKTML
jgi:diaminopimelate dehydrogenase